jgi:toxin FitB
MYLIDTNVISEARKKTKAHPGVTQFFSQTANARTPVYVSAITVGELRRGVELIRHRGDAIQAKILETWLQVIVHEYADKILAFGDVAAQVWGRLSAPDPAHILDKQLAAIALANDLTLVTRNVSDFAGTGVRLKNPFE